MENTEYKLDIIKKEAKDLTTSKLKSYYNYCEEIKTKSVNEERHDFFHELPDRIRNLLQMSDKDYIDLQTYLKNETEFFKLYGEILELATEINELYTYVNKLDKLHTDLNESIEEPSVLLEQLNLFIYKKTYVYKKKLKILKKASQVLVSKYNMSMFNISDTYDISFIKKVMKIIKFDYTLYNISVKSEENMIIEKVTSELSETKDRIYVYKSRAKENEELLYNFHLPITPLNNQKGIMLEDSTLDSLKEGWYNTRNKYREKEGLHLVNFNTLYKENKFGSKEKTNLVFSHISYYNNFDKFIINYIENLSEGDISTYNINTTLFVIDNSYSKLSNWNVNKGFEYNKPNLEKLTSGNYEGSLNYIEYLQLLSGRGPLYINIDIMARMIEHIYNDDFLPIDNLYLKYLFRGSTLAKETVKNIIDNGNNVRENMNRNIIFNFIFLVKDLDNLLAKLKDLNVNGGPQKDRARCNLLDSNLCILDNSIRKSMYLHYMTFCIDSEGKRLKLLDNRDFSFKNIHMNLGKVRW